MSQPVTFQLTESEQLLLLQIARNAVHLYLSNEMPHLPEVPQGALAETHGVFVSIHRDGELRGCVGNVHPASPLYRTAAECAIAAAVADPRFMPLMLADLHKVEFEISVLSTMQRIENMDTIEIGTHGLLISKKTSRGLLLPQVASTYGWNRERFLQETCRKAGLGPDDWKKDAAIHCFSALVFGEGQLHLSASTEHFGMRPFFVPLCLCAFVFLNT
jgi:AmmeMemoRadiSam system protein A